MGTVSLVVYGGNNGKSLEDCLLFSLGEVPIGFIPTKPSLAEDKNVWGIAHTQFYTLYSLYSTRYRTDLDMQGYLMICLFVPVQAKIAGGKGPLDISNAIKSKFEGKYVNSGYLSVQAVNVDGFHDELSKVELDERPEDRRLPVMAGSKPAAIRLKSENQLKALMLYSNYKELSMISNLELAFNCDTTISIPRANIYKEVGQSKNKSEVKDVNEKIEPLVSPNPNAPKHETPSQEKQTVQHSDQSNIPPVLNQAELSAAVSEQKANVEAELAEKLSKFHWGAFCLGWIWGIFNNAKWSLIEFISPITSIIVFLVANSDSHTYIDYETDRYVITSHGVDIGLIFGYNIIFQILFCIFIQTLLGKRGLRIVWRSGRYRDIQRCIKVQRCWNIVGFIYVLIPIIILLFSVLVALMLII